MDYYSASLVKMDKKQVQKIAEESLIWINNERERLMKEYIDEVRVILTKQMNNRWCWWLRRDPTEEEVMAHVNRPSTLYDRPEKEFIEIRYKRWEEVANDLLIACHYAKDEMYVSVEDLARIGYRA